MEKGTWISSTPEHCWEERPLEAGAPGEPSLALTDERGEAWEGFGGCFNELGWIALSALDEGARDGVLRAIFDPEEGCRFSLCRLPIGASDYAAEWYSHNETDGDLAMEHFSIERDRRYLIPYIRAAQKHRPDLALFASPWSPPTWMKFPKAYNYGTLIWRPEVLDAYALYFLKFVQAYGDEGIRIAQIHVQNEPVADQKFPSCLWSGAQMRDFIRDHLGPLFAKSGHPAEIWLGTVNSEDFDGYANTVLRDPGARTYIGGVGYQWAGKGAVQRTHDAWPDVRMLQTENECGDGRNTWAYAHYVFSLMRHYIRNGVRGYVYWNMVLAPRGESTWGWTQNSMVTVDPQTKTVTYSPEFYVMKHFGRYVAPGAVRRGLTGAWAGNAVAFEGPDGGLVVLVNNPFETAQPLSFRSAHGEVRATLEPRSINTLVLS